MQTEAAPREPFTIGLLLRYKVTILVVAVFVILGGYVRIITQPSLYEATARLAVRFTSEAITLGSVDHDSFFRLPLLEEEVKAYMVQIKDPFFINQVLDALPVEGATTQHTIGDGEPSMAQRFRAQFLSVFYSVRKTVLAMLDAILFMDDHVITEREQRVMQVASRLEVTAGTEASHIITVSYRNTNSSLAEQMANTIAKKFIEFQRTKVKKKDETKVRKEAEDAMQALIENRKDLFAVTNRLESPTIEEAVRTRYLTLGDLVTKKKRFEVGLELLKQEIIPYDRELPLETPVLAGELERQYFEIRMRYEELIKQRPDEQVFFRELRDAAELHMQERRKQAIKRDLTVVAAQIKSVTDEIQRLLADTTLAEVSPAYTRLFLAQTVAQARLTRAETELNAVRAFNETLGDETVSENIALWQRAQVPPFPVPQYRELKLIVVIALGMFAGCAAALVHHHLRPKPIRRLRPRTEEEVDVPLIILPDDGKRAVEKGLELDISFPSERPLDEARGKDGRH
jgi:hypothetical protein